MKIYLDIDVFEAAKRRIRYIFQEYPEVFVWVSGGKDSTVIFHMVYEVAKELGRLPLNVGWIDQEAEWKATEEVVKDIMYNSDVKPFWFQMPIKIFNATSFEQDWLHCWDNAEEHMWMRKKDPISIKENIYKTDRFGELYGKIISTHFPKTKIASFGGVRCEESPARFAGLTGSFTYKDITWGKKNTKYHQTFYPLYDWSYSDIWKAIFDHNWKYNKVYDYQYRYGIDVLNMRISNLHHETALKNLFYLPEVEPDTYNKLTQRMSGVDMAVKMNSDDFFIYKLPFMFSDWREYRDFLVEKLIAKRNQESFRKIFKMQDWEYADHPKYHVILKGQVSAILANDHTGTKLKNLDCRYSTPETRAKKWENAKRSGYERTKRKSKK